MDYKEIIASIKLLIAQKEKEVKDLYDQAEGFSAKIKLFVALNWKWFTAAGASFVVGFILGSL